MSVSVAQDSRATGASRNEAAKNLARKRDLSALSLIVFGTASGCVGSGFMFGWYSDFIVVSVVSLVIGIIMAVNT